MMEYIYRIRTDVISDETNQFHTVCGIEVIDAKEGTVLFSIPDVFIDRSDAERMIRLFNEEKLDPIHLPDVINDIITKAHT